MLVVGIAGGTGSGKTTVVKKIIEHLPEGKVALLPQDSYYRDNSSLLLEDRQRLNFDHPESIEWSLLINHIKQLRHGQLIQQPIYSYLTCIRSSETIPVDPKPVIIIEGILVLTDPGLREMMDLKVYVDADADDRLGRVITRDIIDRGRSVKAVLDRYESTVKPMHLEFIEPSKRYADLIIPQGGENEVGIRVLVSLIKQYLADN
ncbi:MAG: uridine kinase [Bacteroidetes bacterium]|jgi:uridine kinase|nr:uridine kinase [Bacteroidota bacterium]MBT3750006.1 uridine kinase [Bacteroidota bacterium]MBT4399456.1 uridine kinase [Bacteroidota bacterium]MBT4410004.1 uridine kinase [Bacteroidota bacterium]MBT5425935.1 uridine kinase [Bacteroidota bacterium]